MKQEKTDYRDVFPNERWHRCNHCGKTVYFPNRVVCLDDCGHETAWAVYQREMLGDRVFRSLQKKHSEMGWPLFGTWMRDKHGFDFDAGKSMYDYIKRIKDGATMPKYVDIGEFRIWELLDGSIRVGLPWNAIDVDKVFDKAIILKKTDRKA